MALVKEEQGVKNVWSDNNFDQLKTQLLKSKLSHYTPNDRYVIEDNDTHYYLPGCSYSLTWYNIIQTFLDIDIPLSSIIVFYNGYDLLERIMPLIPKELQNAQSVPTVVDLQSSCWMTVGGAHDNQFIENFDKDQPVTNQITKHAVSMMGVRRVHRNILYNHIKANNLFDKIATAYNNVS